jgi:heptosyltransferase II
LSFNNILIIKPGAIGDVLHLTPVIRSLKQRFPEARITMLLGSRVTASLFMDNPLIYETIIFDKKGVHRGLKKMISLWHTLREKRYDLVVNYQRSNLKTWFLATATFPARVLVYHKARNRTVHAVVNHLEPLASLGIDPYHEDVHLDFYPAAEDELFAAEYVRRHSLDGKPVVAFNPGTSHLCKCWPIENYALLGDRLVEEMGMEVVILGSRDEKQLAEQIATQMTNVPHDLTGCTLGELGAILKKVDLLVTGDTGPMHIASAVGTPVLALYGPIDPLRSGPVGYGHRIIIHDELDCCPCNSFTCKNTTFRKCMEMITVAEAFETIRQMTENMVIQGKSCNRV